MGYTTRAGATAALLACATPLLAQPAPRDDRPRRTRIAVGAQLVPRYPGADGVDVRPLLDFARARGDDPFPFEAPDASAGPKAYQRNGWAFGPSFGFEGRRTRRETNGRLPPVGLTVEAGGFVQYELTPGWYVRSEVRQGIGGHKGLVANLSADWVARDGDRWLVSLGPRATFSSARYNRAYFGVDPGEVATAGLPAFRPGGGLQAVGATAGAVVQLTERWGLYGYTRYDRMVGDAGRSPVVRDIGSRDQLSGGLALTFTWD